MTLDWRTRQCADTPVETASAITGRDIWAELGGRPGNWREAADLYRRCNARSLVEVVSTVLGQPEPDVRMARRGDIAMVRGCLGVVRGDVIECEGDNVPLGDAQAVWRL